MQSAKTYRLSLSQLLKWVGQLFSKQTIRNFFEQMNNPDQTDGLKAFSAGFGVFMGIIPVWGLQTVAAVFLSVVFKLNKALVVLFSQVSLPPLMPLVVFLSYRAGRFWINDKPAVAHAKVHAHNMSLHFQQYICGSIALAVVLSVITGLVTFAALKIVKMIKQETFGNRWNRAVKIGSVKIN